jgi:hypothetical protein
VKSCSALESSWPDENLLCPKDDTSLRAGAESKPLLGTVVADRDRISRRVGEGGMGAVYLGEHAKDRAKAGLNGRAGTRTPDLCCVKAAL